MRLTISDNYLSRLGIEKAMLQTWDREIKAVGGIKIFIFKIADVNELFSIALLLTTITFLIAGIGALTGGLSLVNFAFLAAGLAVMFYTGWRKPIENHKEMFMKDDELPVVVEMFITGLEVGLSAEHIISNAIKNLKGVMERSLIGVHAKLDSGVSFKDALTNAANQSFCIYYKRFAALIIQNREAGDTDTKRYLEEFLSELEEVRTNKRVEQAGRLDNKLFFPIFLGYFIPILVIFSLPFILSLRGLFGIF